MIEPITVDEAAGVRRIVLRPHQPAAASVYATDHDDDALHLGVRGEDGGLIAVASSYAEALPERATTARRIRGMATLAEHRGQGLGVCLVEAVLADARERGAELVWCNARTTAAGFYAGVGFEQYGDEFDLPPIGPHVVMVRSLA